MIWMSTMAMAATPSWKEVLDAKMVRSGRQTVESMALVELAILSPETRFYREPDGTSIPAPVPDFDGSVVTETFVTAAKAEAARLGITFVDDRREPIPWTDGTPTGVQGLVSRSKDVESVLSVQLVVTACPELDRPCIRAADDTLGSGTSALTSVRYFSRYDNEKTNRIRTRAHSVRRSYEYGPLNDSVWGDRPLVGHDGTFLSAVEHAAVVWIRALAGKRVVSKADRS